MKSCLWFTTVVLSVVFGLLTITQPSQADLVPKRASELITLRAVATGPSTCPVVGVAFNVQISPDGTAHSFSVPDGEVLLITHFQWTDNIFPATGVLTSTLSVQTGSTSNTVLISNGAFDAAGKGGGEVTIPNGIAIKSGSFLCLTNTTADGIGFVHGFLAKDE